MDRLQDKTQKRWAKEVLDFLEHADLTSASLARTMGIHRSGLQHYLGGTRHPSIDVVHRINAAVGNMLGSNEIAKYLESLVAEPIRRTGVTDRSAAQNAKDGFLRALGYVQPYLRDGAPDEIIQAWLDAKAPLKLIYEVNQAFRKEVVSSMDGVVPQKLFVDRLSALYEKHGIALKKWFKPESEVREFRAWQSLHLVVRKSLAETKAKVALRNDLEATIMAAVLNYLNADERNHDLFVVPERLEK